MSNASVAIQNPESSSARDICNLIRWKNYLFKKSEGKPRSYVVSSPKGVEKKIEEWMNILERNRLSLLKTNPGNDVLQNMKIPYFPHPVKSGRDSNPSEEINSRGNSNEIPFPEPQPLPLEEVQEEPIPQNYEERGNIRDFNNRVHPPSLSLERALLKKEQVLRRDSWFLKDCLEKVIKGVEIPHKIFGSHACIDHRSCTYSEEHFKDPKDFSEFLNKLVEDYGRETIMPEKATKAFSFLRRQLAMIEGNLIPYMFKRKVNPTEVSLGLKRFSELYKMSGALFKALRGNNNKKLVRRITKTKLFPSLDYIQRFFEKYNSVQALRYVGVFSSHLGELRNGDTRKEDIERICREHKLIPDIEFVQSQIIPNLQDSSRRREYVEKRQAVLERDIFLGNEIFGKGKEIKEAKRYLGLRKEVRKITRRLGYVLREATVLNGSTESKSFSVQNPLFRFRFIKRFFQRSSKEYLEEPVGDINIKCNTIGVSREETKLRGLYLKAKTLQREMKVVKKQMSVKGIESFERIYSEAVSHGLNLRNSLQTLYKRYRAMDISRTFWGKHNEDSKEYSKHIRDEYISGQIRKMGNPFREIKKVLCGAN